ncbi:aminotransferase class V-fold PLP-dependent enzyme [Nitrogeniibacter mangrovi]|uniref:Aminotransferase class V-fold PLP-dependent enzyme n=1 Tax=Nitrogeniibacter mangrovi TaxID=2016596 RepID=A0A6C1AXT2_9RHOO|nr:aminotransferase class V-fold PLP-dependent enzyme [Nitrogeniibacter mangrovi]QID16156.1 aminotransferase class V-fold PLP-dependent enzyme [Nitrogeniibacter mangrovi]
MPLDLDFVRRCFPAFAEPTLTSTAFFENAGGSYACAPVIDRLDTYIRRLKVQPYGAYPASREAGEWMDESYRRLAPYLGVPDDWLHFGPSTSQNTYVLAQAFRRRLAPGDEIVVTNQDHEANSGVWRRLAADGVAVREWRVDPDSGHLDPAALARLLGPRTRLVCFPHCSNIVAEINPVADIVAMAHAHGAHCVVDAVSFAGHGFPDVAALGADAYLFSLYKTFGPHQGLMVIRPELRAELGNEGHYFNADQPRKCLTPAGPDHAQVAAAAGIADYFDALDAHHHPGAPAADRPARVRALMHAADTALLARLLDGLAARPGLRVLGPQTPDARAATVAVVPDEPTPLALAEALGQRGLMVGASHFYAVRLLEAIGIDPARGVLRLSMVHYTSADDVDRLLAGLDAVMAAR